MKQLKRLTSVLLVLGLVLGRMPLSAFAAEPEDTAETTFTVTKPDNGGENTYAYKLLDDGTVELTGFLPGVSVADVVIPSTVTLNGKDYSVTSIGTGAFYECTALQSVQFEAPIKSIGFMAFALCTGLTSIALPEGLETIGQSAFAYCTGLVSVTIPQSIQVIKYGAFDYGYGSTKKLEELHYTGTKAQWEELMKKEISHADDGHDYVGEIGKMNPMLTGIDQKNFYCAHTVSFDCGSQAGKTSKVVLYEGTVTPPDDPTADGYQFKGWYTQENDGELFDFTLPIKEDVTVYAHWSVKPTPTPDPNPDPNPNPEPNPEPNPNPNPDPEPNPTPTPDPTPTPTPTPDHDTDTAKEYTLTEKDGTLVCVTVEKNGTTVDITKNVVLKKTGHDPDRKDPCGRNGYGCGKCGTGRNGLCAVEHQ